MRLLSEFSERFTNSVQAQMIGANLTAFGLLNTDYTAINPYAAAHMDFEKAINWYDRIISQDPKNIAALNNRGIAISFSVAPKTQEDALRIALGTGVPGSFKTGMEKAIESFDAVIKLDPENFAANYNKGMALGILRKNMEAIKCFEVAVKTGLKIGYRGSRIPDLAGEENVVSLGSTTAMTIMSGVAKYVVDTAQTEVVDGNRIVSTAPTETYISNENDAMAFCNFQIGLCYARAGPGEYRNALQYFDKAVGLNPNVPKFYKFRGLVDLSVRPEYSDKDAAKVAEIMQRMMELDAKRMKELNIK